MLRPPPLLRLWNRAFASHALVRSTRARARWISTKQTPASCSGWDTDADIIAPHTICHSQTCYEFVSRRIQRCMMLFLRGTKSCIRVVILGEFICWFIVSIHFNSVYSHSSIVFIGHTIWLSKRDHYRSKFRVMFFFKGTSLIGKHLLMYIISTSTGCHAYNRWSATILKRRYFSRRSTHFLSISTQWATSCVKLEWSGYFL